MAWAFFRGCKGYHLENGRVLLGGTYGEMIFETLPVNLGKVTISVVLRSEAHEPEELAALQMHIPGSKDTLLIPSPRDENLPQPPMDEGGKLLDAQQIFVTGRIPNLKEGRVKLWAVTKKGEKVYAGSLAVRLRRPEDRDEDLFAVSRRRPTGGIYFWTAPLKKYQPRPVRNRLIP